MLPVAAEPVAALPPIAAAPVPAGGDTVTGASLVLSFPQPGLNKIAAAAQVMLESRCPARLCSIMERCSRSRMRIAFLQKQVEADMNATPKNQLRIMLV
jgi:hypothetical protein